VFIATLLHQNIENIPVLIDRPSEIMALVIDREEDLVEMPYVAESGTSAPELVGIRLPERAAPFADGFIGHDHPTGQQQLFDIAVAETEPVVQPHAMADDPDRKAVILVAVGR
jgi:hypothetical protein